MAGKVAIVGGSIGGLFAAAVLKRAGFHVRVFERVGTPLHGRGAGVVTHPQLLDALAQIGADLNDLGVQLHDRVAFDREGQPFRIFPYLQVATSWDRVYQALRGLIPDEDYHMGERLQGFEEVADGVRLQFESGTQYRADILVGADGFRSVVRGQLLPDVQPEFSGYVVWRALALESEIAPSIRDRVFNKFGMYLPQGTQFVGYPIAGENNDLRPGHRRYNFVWYVPVEEAALKDMLTDESGMKHAISIPPPLVRQEILDEAVLTAKKLLPDVFTHVLSKSERPFFTPIYDHVSPSFATGRVALLGDAACVARPHVGMGVTKAAQDALALARHLTSKSSPEALRGYSDERQPASHAAFERSRRLGHYMMEGPADGENTDGRNNPYAEEILRLTAVADFP